MAARRCCLPRGTTAHDPAGRLRQRLTFDAVDRSLPMCVSHAGDARMCGRRIACDPHCRCGARPAINARLSVHRIPRAAPADALERKVGMTLFRSVVGPWPWRPRCCCRLRPSRRAAAASSPAASRTHRGRPAGRCGQGRQRSHQCRDRPDHRRDRVVPRRIVGGGVVPRRGVARRVRNGRATGRARGGADDDDRRHAAPGAIQSVGGRDGPPRRRARPGRADSGVGRQRRSGRPTPAPST